MLVLILFSSKVTLEDIKNTRQQTVLKHKKDNRALRNLTQYNKFKKYFWLKEIVDIPHRVIFVIRHNMIEILRIVALQK